MDQERCGGVVLIRFMKKASKNPWLTLGVTKPYIAVEDKIFFHKNQRALSHLRTDVLPDAYLGNLEKAKVVFLLLNPGFQERDINICVPGSQYFDQNKLSLQQKSKPPFYVLGNKFKDSGGYEWWTKKLKSIINAGISIETLSEKIVCIQYFPYHSEKYKHYAKTLPSQEYSFGLVRKAIQQKKKIVLMRSEKLWLQAVPELKGKYVKVKSFLNPVISINNMSQKEFNEIIKILS